MYGFSGSRIYALFDIYLENLLKCFQNGIRSSLGNSVRYKDFFISFLDESNELNDLLTTCSIASSLIPRKFKTLSDSSTLIIAKLFIFITTITHLTFQLLPIPSRIPVPTLSLPSPNPNPNPSPIPFHSTSSKSKIEQLSLQNQDV